MPPADADAAKAKILGLGWNLSYIEDSAELSDLAAGFDFECEDGLSAYLIAKDSGNAAVLEVLFFCSETDASTAVEMLAGKLSDPDGYDCYGRFGSQVWYGTESAVKMYLG